MITVPSGAGSEIPAPRKVHVRDFLRASAYGALALGAVVIGSVFGNVHGPTFHLKIVAWVSAAVLLVFGCAAIRRVAIIAAGVVSPHAMPSASAAIRLTIGIAGYVVIIFAVLGVLSVSITHLLVGGALTGVVVGIAAQQSLGNVFAGIVLLLARPFNIGDHIRVRSGALGGVFDGVVLGMSLTYVTIYHDGGPMKIPNSSMLAAAVGPYVPPA